MSTRRARFNNDEYQATHSRISCRRATTLPQMSSELQEKQRTLEIQERLKAISPYLQALLEAHDGNDWLQAAVRRQEERRAKQVGPVSMQDPRYLASLIGWDPVAGAPFADSDRGDARKLSGIFIALAHSNRKWWPGSDRRAERIVERLLARAHNERLRAGDAHRTEIADRRELPGVRVYRERAGRRSTHETSAADTSRPSGAPRDSASPAKPAPTTGRPSTSSAQEAHEQARVAQEAHEQARAELTRESELYREVGDRAGEIAARRELAGIYLGDLEEGSYEQARAELTRVLELRRELGDRAGEAETRHQLANIDLERRAHRERAGRRSAHETSAADTSRPSGASRDSASPAKPAPTTGRPSTSSAQETRVAASASRRDGRLRRIATITVVVVALILLVPAGLYLALRNDPREKRAREALAVGVLAQTRDVGRVDLNESESARVLDKTGEIELDLHEDGGALRSDLACVESKAWRLTEQETIEVCVLVEPASGRMLGSFERMQSKPLVGANCKGQAVADEVRCRGR